MEKRNGQPVVQLIEYVEWFKIFEMYCKIGEIEDFDRIAFVFGWCCS